MSLAIQPKYSNQGSTQRVGFAFCPNGNPVKGVEITAAAAAKAAKATPSFVTQIINSFNKFFRKG
jgi:hypothetical protein